MLYDKRWSKTDVAAPVEPWRNLLLHAADILERDGWCQGQAHELSTDRSCALGAMARACRDIGGPLVYGIAQGVLEAHVGQHGVGWNDEPGRTAEEVIATMRRVARS